MTAHARLSPSGATRWMTCPGSVPGMADMKDDRTSEYAAEGTLAHEVREDCLLFGLEPFDFVGQERTVDGFEFEVDEEMAEHLQPGIDLLRDFPGELVIEHRVDLSRWLPGQFGTLDAGGYNATLIVIDDLKFGRGIPVSPVENQQLMIYALGFWDNIARHHTDATDFLIRIDQPRCPGGGGEWRTTLDELLAFGEELRVAGERTYDPNAPRVASQKACFWCKLKGTCDEYVAFNLEKFSLDIADLDDLAVLGAPPPLPLVRSLTPERRSYLVQHKKMLEGFLDDLHADLLNDVLAGRPAPGFKAVEGRKPARKWIDTEAAQGILVGSLRDDAFTRKLISPTQAEKVLKPGRKRKGDPEAWEDLSELIRQGDGKPILVAADDPRPAVPGLLDGADFDDLPEQP